MPRVKACQGFADDAGHGPACVEFRRQAERFVSGAPAHRLPCLFCQNETIAGRHAFVSPIGGATIADGGGKPGRDIIPPPETDRSTIAKRRDGRGRRGARSRSRWRRPRHSQSRGADAILGRVFLRKIPPRSGPHAHRVAPRRGGCAAMSPRPRRSTYGRGACVFRGFRKV